MAEPLFFRRPSGLTVGQIASLTEALPPGSAQLTHRITNVAPLDLAGSADLAFIEKVGYADDLASTKAGACLMTERFESRAPGHVIVLRVSAPYKAFIAVARKLYPDALRPCSLFEAEGVAAGAFIHSSARLESGVIVDPGAVIGPSAAIGAGTVIGANAVIGPNVRVGRGCSMGAGSSITHALIGDRVVIHPGARIGQDGFGFVRAARSYAKVPQMGRVIIQDDVEIGAGTTIDRGSMRDTVIGEGTKIDNLVQIGHNVSIGRHCMIVSQCGISGSVTIEDFAILAGQVGIADHKTIGQSAVIGAKSGVASDVPAGERWFGNPAMPLRQFLRAWNAMKKIGEEKWHINRDRGLPEREGDSR